MSHKKRPAYRKAVARETKGPLLAQRDWAEVYYALGKKAQDLEAGLYGDTDEETSIEEWAEQLRSIMTRIENAGIQV